MYEPESEELKELRRIITENSWKQRIAKARSLERRVTKVLSHIDNGYSQNSAIEAVGRPSQRSQLLRALSNYRRQGFEGLIDRRKPRERTVSVEQRQVIETARRANGEIVVEDIRSILSAQFANPASEATIKRVLNEAGLNRPAVRPKKREDDKQIERLGAAGLELVRAAEVESGAVQALVQAVLDVAQQLPPPGEVNEEEVALRNGKGQLTARYNRSRRKKLGEAIAKAYRTSAEKAEQRDLGRLSFRAQGERSIEAKMWALLSMPVLTSSNRIDELYGPRGKFLQGICGYEYMPETLRKTVSEWTVAGVGYVVQKVHAATWHKVSSQRWETGYQASVIYVDNLSKPLWSRMFVKSAKVSSTGRVQPALVSTYIHTGAGVPIHFETHSGTAPLAPRVLQLLERVEAQSECPVGRLTVIDGECCSAELLRKFKSKERDLVTPLSATLAKPERIRFEAGSAPQPYRDGDSIREGKVVLRDSKDSGREVEARAIVIEQRTKAEWTVLATLADREQWPARRLADVYFSRWPNQEGVFRLANGAVKLNKVHGYGKRMVVNTSVITKLDELDAKLVNKKGSIDALGEQLEEIEVSITDRARELFRIERYLGKRQERVDGQLSAERTHTTAFVQAVSELRESSDRFLSVKEELGKLRRSHDELTAKQQKAKQQVATWVEERSRLNDRREILEADVSQDILYSVLKLTLAMLVQFVVVEYFPHRRMEWTTFLSRLALLSGRRETDEKTVTTYIEANERDRKFMEALEKACERINGRKLKYKDKYLRYIVEWPEA